MTENTDKTVTKPEKISVTRIEYILQQEEKQYYDQKSIIKDYLYSPQKRIIA